MDKADFTLLVGPKWAPVIGSDRCMLSSVARTQAGLAFALTATTRLVQVGVVKRGCVEWVCLAENAAYDSGGGDLAISTGKEITEHRRGGAD